MKVWKKALIGVAAALAVAILSLVIAKYAYVAKYNGSKRELDFACSDTNVTDGEIKVMSANLRCDAMFDFGKRTWQYRADLIAKNIEQVKPTIIGMQEATKWQYEYYRDILKNYDSEIVYRDTTFNSEGCPIFYRSDLYDLVDKGSFWLSETPDVMSKDWGAACYRICSYVILQDKATESEFVVFNTHLDHVSDLARINGINVVLEKIRQFGGLPSVIMGDLNAEENSDTYRAATENFDDVKYRVSNGYIGHCTYQNWGTQLDYPTIDYFMISKAGFTVNSYEVITATYNGAYPSDHFSIVTKLTLTN
ncbi:MAG: endonuclease/exonuclease/phosphatase family protein [Firmicutes bacterium]|nr:endonuclease/exonuclease/phosphatase family protein [Bacillota bacterium]